MLLLQGGLGNLHRIRLGLLRSRLLCWRKGHFEAMSKCTEHTLEVGNFLLYVLLLQL